MPIASPTGRRAALEGRLRQVRSRFTALGAETGPPARAAEWLLDNAHLVLGALRQVGEDLPKGFVRSLPVTREGELRVAGLARQAAAGPGSLDLDRIRRAVEGFQEEIPLTLGELWALPALLRLEAVESLVHAAEQLLAGTAPGGGEGEAERIAAAVLILRALSAADWRPFVESVSRVEQELRRDPAGVYARMDFATRDLYRKEVERLARGSRATEEEVARAAVLLAGEAEDGDARRRHAGHFLIGGGRPALERRIGFRPSWRARPGRWVRRHATPAYLGSVTLATLTATLLPVAWAASLGVSLPQLAVLGALLLVPAGTVAVSLINAFVTLSLAPRALPRMGFEDDLPDGCRTLVVVPAMLTSEDEVLSLLAGLEVRFLGNSGKNLGFALLSDWGDAPAREMPGDAALLTLAADGIRELDARLRGEDGVPRFFLLHRERRWNPGEGVWMGWE
ncbi:MAG TPA: hypothetical protein VF414_01510, partial [Thermoanaerobaculia bacterium]